TSGLSFAFAPSVLLGSYPLLLVIQTVAISLTALSLYYVGSRILGNAYAGLVVALSFLISFAVAGVNWFDLHYEAFFIPLFVSGYALTISGRNRTGYTLLALSGLANFPFMIFPAFFALQSLVYRRWHSYTMVGPMWKPAPRSYDLILLGVAFAVLVSSYVELSTVGPNLSGFLHTTGAGGPGISADARLETIFFLVGPFAFLPLLSPRWALYLVPWFFVVLTSPATFYQYPGLFFTQYSAAIIPFLFMGTID
ncbi:membrane protein, partial [mine drainage metagenome]